MDEECRTCWVCYNSESENPNLSWIKPCRCKGATKWVHQHCLQRWVDEKQRGDYTVKVNCRVCNTPYNIRYPSPGLMLDALQKTDNIINKLCPFIAGGCFISGIFWVAVSYGALTMMQYMGHSEAIEILEETDPLVIVITLPAIPIMLVLFKLIRWDEFILNIWQKYSYRIPYINKLFGTGDIPEWRHEYNMQFPMSSNQNFLRLTADALLTPTISTFMGQIFFSRISPRWQRNALGTIVFILSKGFMNIFYQQKKYLRNCRREILDWIEPTADTRQNIENQTSGVDVVNPVLESQGDEYGTNENILTEYSSDSSYTSEPSDSYRI